MILDIIDPIILLFSLCIGLLYTIIYLPEPINIIIYPTPYNSGKIKYMDNTGSCYKYNITKVRCPLNNKLIKRFEPQ